MGSTLKSAAEESIEKYYEELNNSLELLQNKENRLIALIDEFGIELLDPEDDDKDFSVEVSLSQGLKLLPLKTSDKIINLFNKLGVFAEEGFSLEAAIAISDFDQASTRNYIDVLCNRSILDKSKENNEYYFLHPVIYSFCLKKLRDDPDPTRYEQAKEKHAKYFLDKLNSLNESETLDISEEDKSNIFKAIEWLRGKCT